MGLKWKEKNIRCYVVGRNQSFSDPLTVRIQKNKNDFVDLLTHELIHQLQSQNNKITKKWWKYASKKYEGEPKITLNHVLLLAVHKKILIEIFNKNRFRRNVKRTAFPDYKRSWKIVEEEGYENI